MACRRGAIGGAIKALLQRVRSAYGAVDGATIAHIDGGLLVFLGVEQSDDEAVVQRLIPRLLGYRVFADEAGRMNRSLVDVAGGLLLVPQFTLAADTTSGTRPGFSRAAPPAQARQLFDASVQVARDGHAAVASGHFGADMAVHLVNDGPVTFWLEAA